MDTHDLPSDIATILEAIHNPELPSHDRMRLIEQLPTYIRILHANARRPE